MRRFVILTLLLAVGCAAHKKEDTKEKISAAVPGKNLPLLGEANLAYSAGDLTRAHRLYGMAIDMEPTAEAHYLRARTALDLGSLDQAERDLTAAIDLDGTHWPARSLRGVLRERQGRRDEARIFFREATALAPNEFAPRNNLAFLYLLDGENKAAYEEFRKLVDKFPDRSRAWNNLAIAADRLGKRNEAQHAYSRAEALEGAQP
jgi:Flp pilus assembly protein TadD